MSIDDLITATHLGYPIHVGCGGECRDRNNVWQPLWTCMRCGAYPLYNEVAQPVAEGFSVEDMESLRAERDEARAQRDAALADVAGLRWTIKELEKELQEYAE